MVPPPFNEVGRFDILKSLKCDARSFLSRRDHVCEGGCSFDFETALTLVSAAEDAFSGNW